MLTREFRENRSRFPRAELAKHRDSWVAFSPDGRRIVASAESLERLEGELAAVGEDVGGVVLEHIPGPEGDVVLGAEELG